MYAHRPTASPRRSARTHCRLPAARVRWASTARSTSSTTGWAGHICAPSLRDAPRACRVATWRATACRRWRCCAAWRRGTSPPASAPFGRSSGRTSPPASSAHAARGRWAATPPAPRTMLEAYARGGQLLRHRPRPRRHLAPLLAPNQIDQTAPEWTPVDSPRHRPLPVVLALLRRHQQRHRVRRHRRARHPVRARRLCRAPRHARRFHPPGPPAQVGRGRRLPRARRA